MEDGWVGELVGKKRGRRGVRGGFGGNGWWRTRKGKRSMRCFLLIKVWDFVGCSRGWVYSFWI